MLDEKQKVFFRRAIATLVLIALLVAVWIVHSSSLFQSCVNDQTTAANQYIKEGLPPNTFVFADLAAIYIKCAGHALYPYRDVVTAIATVFIAFFTATLWNATKRLTTISTQQVRYFETAERPWISVTAELRSPLTFKDGRGQIRIALRLFNTGRSPAIGVDIRTVICPISIDAIKELKKLSETKPPYDSWLDEDHDAPGWRRRTFGKTMFPNEPLGVSENLVMQPDEIEAAAKRDRTNFINPAIVGLVTYKSAFSKTEHHTGFIIDLAIAIPEVPDVYPGLLLNKGRADDQEIPTSRMVLHSTFISGYVT
jgi:hypothetical protein